MQDYSIQAFNAVKKYLDEARGFRCSRSIETATGVRPVTLRRMASDHPQTFVAGSCGYKLVRHATLEEINDNIRTLLSRSEKIMHRARSLQRYALERSKARDKLIRIAART